MDTGTLLTLDPGEATGWFYGAYDKVTPLQRISSGIIPGGAVGLSKFLVDFFTLRRLPTHVVAERFVPDGTDGAAEMVSPQGEGVILALLGERVRWQLRGDKALGYSSVAEADDLLRRRGWWLTGADCAWKDGRDANDAALHAIKLMRTLRHRPTLQWLWPRNEEAPTGT